MLMREHLWPALRGLVILTLLTGVAYPLAITGLAQAVFRHQANGSIVENEGRPVGSALIGQAFDQPGYFWSRPSATGSQPYNSAASAGSNYGPLHPDLAKAVAERVAALRSADASQSAPPPVDLVTASGSGLDPHISPAAAAYQVGRVARARGIDESAVRELVARHTERRTFGLLGERRVNVLTLNLALDSLDAAH